MYKVALGHVFLQIISVLMKFHCAQSSTLKFISMLFVCERQAGDALDNSEALERKY
jgi:hypothetical protein